METIVAFDCLLRQPESASDANFIKCIFECIKNFKKRKKKPADHTLKKGRRQGVKLDERM